MGYVAGVDLGTTFTAAAVARDGQAEMISLGSAGTTMPTVVLLRSDGALLVGDAAAQRGLTEPDRVARRFKRRVGDPAPILLGDSPLAAHVIMGKLLDQVVQTISERQGGPPDRTAVTHPANWGGYKREHLEQAIRVAGLEQVATLSEPEAAAVHYADQERVPVGSRIAVYDLGGGTFDAAVLHKSESAFELVGEPEGIEQLGGIDFDQAIFQFVCREAGVDVAGLADDPTTQAPLQRLLQDCADAKVALSSDTDSTVPVLLPGTSTQVRITRTEFEAMIRPAIEESVAALRRAVERSGADPSQLDAVLLVGGSSRIPLVGQLVSAGLGLPVAVDADPKHAIALGAALSAELAEEVAAAAPAPAESSAPPRVAAAAPPTGSFPSAPAPAPVARGEAGPVPLADTAAAAPARATERSRVRTLGAASGGLVGVALLLVSRSNDGATPWPQLFMFILLTLAVAAGLTRRAQPLAAATVGLVGGAAVASAPSVLLVERQFATLGASPSVRGVISLARQEVGPQNSQLDEIGAIVGLVIMLLAVVIDGRWLVKSPADLDPRTRPLIALALVALFVSFWLDSSGLFDAGRPFVVDDPGEEFATQVFSTSFLWSLGIGYLLALLLAFGFVATRAAAPSRIRAIGVVAGVLIVRLGPSLIGFLNPPSTTGDALVWSPNWTELEPVRWNLPVVFLTLTLGILTMVLMWLRVPASEPDGAALD